MKKIMVFIPIYNCEKQIVRVLKQFNNEILKYISEIVIINNRSTDDSENVIINYNKNNMINTKVTLLRNNDNYNLGGSHKVAFDYALKNKYDYLIVLHGDDQGKIKDLLSILKAEEYLKYDALLGSRFLKSSKLDGYSKLRTFGNKIYNFLFSISMRRRIYDLGAGLNMYDVRIFKDKYYLKYPDKLTFNCYMLFASKSYNQKFKFFPITWSEDDQVSNVKMISQAWITLKIAVSYFFKGTKFLEREHRNKIISKYRADVIYQKDGEKDE